MVGAIVVFWIASGAGERERELMHANEKECGAAMKRMKSKEGRWIVDPSSWQSRLCTLRVVLHSYDFVHMSLISDGCFAAQTRFDTPPVAVA